MEAVGLLQEHRTDVLVKWQKLKQGANLLHIYYTMQMCQILDLEKFDGAIINQDLHHISISESGQM